MAMRPEAVPPEGADPTLPEAVPPEGGEPMPPEWVPPHTLSFATLSFTFPLGGPSAPRESRTVLLEAADIIEVDGIPQIRGAGTMTEFRRVNSGRLDLVASGFFVVGMLSGRGVVHSTTYHRGYNCVIVVDGPFVDGKLHGEVTIIQSVREETREYRGTVQDSEFVDGDVVSFGSGQDLEYFEDGWHDEALEQIDITLAGVYVHAVRDAGVILG